MKSSVYSKLAWVLFFGSNSMALMAQDATQFSAIDEVKTILKIQESKWNTGDLNGFMEGYWKNDSLVFIGSKGPTYGFDSTLLNYQKGYPDKAAMGTLHFDLLFTKQWDSSTIQVVGKFTLSRINDKSVGFFTLLFRKINNSWKIVSDHSSTQTE